MEKKGDDEEGFVKQDAPKRRESKKAPKEITFNDIKESITGCARIIKYQAIYGDTYSKDVSLL